MALTVVKSVDCRQVGEVNLSWAPDSEKISERLLRDAYVMYESRRRQGTAFVKTKGMIAGSKKKLFRQKGTGNARMGQKRTPLRRGGGSAFGKQSKDWSYRLPKKALLLATRMSLMAKFKSGAVSVIENLGVTAPRTKLVAEMLKSHGCLGKKCLVVVSSYSQTMWLACRNLQGVTLTTADWINSYDIMKNRVVLIDREAFKVCLARVGVAL